MDVPGQGTSKQNGDCENEKEANLKLNSSHNFKLNIMYANVDSLANKVQELKFRINDTYSKPHIIALTEIKQK